MKDISFLRNLKKLEHLDFRDNAIESVDFLESLVLLKSLSFSGNPVKSISALSQLNSLTRLFMAGVPVKDITPIKDALNLNWLYAGPVEDFDGAIVSRFTELNGLQLNQCAINDVSFLQPLKKLHDLNLDDNNISDLMPLYEVKQVPRISLKNNEISEPFQQLQFNNLTILNLQDNPFGNKLYEHDYWSGLLTALSIDTANYWLERGEDDKALAHCYVNAGGKIPLVIYYKKLVACEPDDDYFRLYYVMRCEILIRNLKEEDQEILDIKAHIIRIIKESNFFNKSELLVSLEEGGKNVLNYNQYSEYAAYLKSNEHVKPHPEMLYKLGSTLNGRDNLLELLSIYKQLTELESPLHIALSGPIRRILRNNFAGTPDDLSKRTKYQDLLLHAGEREIPFFDTTMWFKERYDNYVHDRPRPRIVTTPKPTTPPSYSYERSYPEVSAWKIIARLLFVTITLLSLLKACK